MRRTISIGERVQELVSGKALSAKRWRSQGKRS
jgi:hypothetical protein